MFPKLLIIFERAQMENQDKIEQTKAPTTEAPEPGEPKPVSKTWQEYATKILYFLRDWFLKLRAAYKILLIIFIAVILVLILLAYLGVFGQDVSNLIKQLINKIMEQIGTKKS
jgi:predicted PurR-regulated permease PerM